MCQHLNEPDNRLEFLQTVIEMKDRRISELEYLVDELKSEIRHLEEYAFESPWSDQD